MTNETALVPVDRIERAILSIRGQKIILDTDLAALYEVPTKVLNQAVKRNRHRFPPDFMFQLTPEEKAEVVINCDHLSRLKFSAVLPHAFTEHGAIMAATILNSPRAVEVSIYVVRAFVRLGDVVATDRVLAHKLAELEGRVPEHDHEIRALVEAIRRLMAPGPPKRRPIGFHRDEEGT